MTVCGFSIEVLVRSGVVGAEIKRTICLGINVRFRKLVRTEGFPMILILLNSIFRNDYSKFKSMLD